MGYTIARPGAISREVRYPAAYCFYNLANGAVVSGDSVNFVLSGTPSATCRFMVPRDWVQDTSIRMELHFVDITNTSNRPEFSIVLAPTYGPNVLNSTYDDLIDGTLFTAGPSSYLQTQYYDLPGIGLVRNASTEVIVTRTSGGTFGGDVVVHAVSFYYQARAAGVVSA